MNNLQEIIDRIDLDSILAEIERDLAWREDELRYFENRITVDLDIDENKVTIETKPLVLFLYANFEGHAKLMLAIYVNTLNSCNLNCQNITYPLMASSLHSEFGALKNPDKRHPLFPKVHEPEFKELGRRVDFFEHLEDIFSKVLKLNVDKVVDTESNLKPAVLKKIFFRLGFDVTSINEGDFSQIQRLLKLRNDFAHGSRQQGISYKEYSEIRQVVFKILRNIKGLVIDYLSNAKFLRNNSSI